MNIIKLRRHVRLFLELPSGHVISVQCMCIPKRVLELF